jgi:lipoprotein-releasing system permease protein
MNLPFRIARRYLFGKKSTNAINIITGIAVFGVAIGAAAMILILSVFNGFQDLLAGLFSHFNPEVKITPREGKFFTPDSSKIYQIKQLPNVQIVSETIEEVAFFEYAGSQDFGMLKGVDDQFNKINGIDSTIHDGEYKLREGNRTCAVLGVGMRNKLSVNITNPIEQLLIYMPKEKEVTSALDQAFKKRATYPVATFAIQQDYDNQYILTTLDLARELLEKPNAVSALELKLRDVKDAAATMASIQQILGNEVELKDRYQQEEAFLKIMNIEKWMSFAILSLTLLLIAFNIVGSLWMIVLEKKKDIAIFKAMGAEDSVVRAIFLGEGGLICGLGLAIGFGLAILIYAIHHTYGLVPIPEGFIVDKYPALLKWYDFVAVTAIVLFIGLLASLPPARKAVKIGALVRED